MEQVQNKKILKQTSVILPDQVSEHHDRSNPLEVQPCELERHKQEPEYPVRQGGGEGGRQKH